MNKKLKAVIIALLGIGIIGVVALPASASVFQPNATGTTVTPGPNTVVSSTIKDGGVFGWDMADNTIPWLKLGSQLRGEIRAAQTRSVDAYNMAEDALAKPDNGGKLLAKSFEPVVVANCGGTFKTQKTKIGEFTLPAGKDLSVDSYLFASRTASGAPGTIAQLALRIGSTETAFGEDRGTVLTPLPAFKNREVTGTSIWDGDNDAPVTVEVFAFCYNDNAEGSADGAGQWTARANVRVTQG